MPPKNPRKVQKVNENKIKPVGQNELHQMLPVEKIGAIEHIFWQLYPEVATIIGLLENIKFHNKFVEMIKNGVHTSGNFSYNPQTKIALYNKLIAHSTGKEANRFRYDKNFPENRSVFGRCPSTCSKEITRFLREKDDCLVMFLTAFNDGPEFVAGVECRSGHAAVGLVKKRNNEYIFMQFDPSKKHVMYVHTRMVASLMARRATVYLIDGIKHDGHCFALCYKFIAQMMDQPKQLLQRFAAKYNTRHRRTYRTKRDIVKLDQILA